MYVRLGKISITNNSALRGELFFGLLDSFAYNLDQGDGALNAFEMERVFWSEDGELKEKDQYCSFKLLSLPTMNS